MTKAVLFDLDNTLINRDAAVQAYCRGMLRRWMPAYDPSRHEAILVRIIAADDHGYTPRDQWCRVVSEMVGRDKVTPDELWRDFQERLPALVPAPSLRPQLARLAQRMMLVLVTNGSSAMQRAKIHAAGLEDVFPRPLISGELGYAKPDERVFRRALECAQSVPEETVMVGDDPLRDIDAAARLGIRTCWISLGRDYPAGVLPPDRIVDSVDEFLEVV